MPTSFMTMMRKGREVGDGPNLLVLVMVNICMMVGNLVIQRMKARR